MPKLRYKEQREKKERKHDDKKRKSTKKGKKEKPYKPPTLYEEEGGWEPPSNSHKQDEAAWRAHLFDAMIDDEGQDPFYTCYQQPTPSSDSMTEEEYRQHIVQGMYRRTHAQDIAAEEKRQAEKEKKRQEKEKLKLEQEKRHAEQIRLQQAYSQLRKIDNSKADYAEKWKKLDMLEAIHKNDIPWPLVGKSFNLDSVRSFVVGSNSSNDMKKNVRKEQTRYHPDKFITRYMKKFKGSEKERERVLTHINEISGWLNEIWTQLNKN